MSNCSVVRLRGGGTPNFTDHRTQNIEARSDVLPADSDSPFCFFLLALWVAPLGKYFWHEAAPSSAWWPWKRRSCHLWLHRPHALAMLGLKGQLPAPVSCLELQNESNCLSTRPTECAMRSYKWPHSWVLATHSLCVGFSQCSCFVVYATVLMLTRSCNLNSCWLLSSGLVF